MEASKKTHSNRHRITAVSVSLAGVFLTLAMAVWTWHLSLGEYRQRFNHDVAVRSEMVTDYLDKQLIDLGGLKRFIEGTDRIDADSFRRFVAPMLERRGIQAIEWVPVVPADRRDAVESAPDGALKVTELTADGSLIPAGKRKTYYPVHYVEPLKGNEKAVGFDLGSNSKRFESIQAAISKSRPQATARIKLVQEKGDQYGFLVFVPVYAADRLRGFALGVFRAGDMLENAVKQSRVMKLDTVLTDLSAQPEERLLAKHASRSKDTGSGFGVDALFFPLLSADRAIDFAGRSWNVAVSTTPAYRARFTSFSFLVVLLVGLMLTALLSLYMNLVLSHRDRAEMLVIERTRELADSNVLMNEHLVELEQTQEHLQEQTAALEEEMQERRSIQESMDELNQRFSLATDSARIGVWDYFIPENRLIWDKWMYALYGIREEDFSGAYQAWQNGLHPDDKVRGAEEIAMALRGEKDFDTEFRVVWPSGEVRHIKANALVLRDTGGSPFRMIGVNYDITERKRFEEELRIARDEAVAANGAKSSFLSTMSHEIRTPLNSILGMADVLAETGLTGEQGENLALIHSAGETLLGLIDNILDLSKIEAGMLQLDAAVFNLPDSIQQMMGMMAMRSSQKNITLTSQLASSVPVWVVGDPFRLGQILLNLVGNAIKFTDKGSVSLDVETVPARDAGIWLRFSITDTGIGIPADKLRTIFEVFSQADGSTTRKYGGSGLGLSISRSLIEMMGGAISVESAPGLGSCFSFTVCFAAPPETQLARPEKTAEEAGATRPISILLVDDNSDNRTVLKAYFRKTEHRVDMAENGEEALAKIKGGSYELVFMDMEMPVMDGYTAVRLIREWERETGRDRLPIIALTANALKEDHQRSLDAGCTYHLTKPIHKESLLRVVGEYSAV